MAKQVHLSGFDNKWRAWLRVNEGGDTEVREFASLEHALDYVRTLAGASGIRESAVRSLTDVD